MEEHLIPYFAAEKQESLLFMLAGVAAVAVSIWLFVTGSRYKGMGDDDTVFAPARGAGVVAMARSALNRAMRLSGSRATR